MEIRIGPLEHTILFTLALTGPINMGSLATLVCGGGRKCYKKVWKSVNNLARKGYVVKRRDKNGKTIVEARHAYIVVSYSGEPVIGYEADLHPT